MEQWLKDEHMALEGTVRAFCEREVRPFCRDWEREGMIPLSLLKKTGELGLMGVCVPPEFGGSGMDTLSYAISIRELGKADPSLGLTIAAHNSLCTGHILTWGNEEQKKKYLPGLATGDKLGAWCLTEAGSGSDASSLKTKAEKCENGWVIDGNKMFITQGSTADIYVILARTGRLEENNRISAFIAEKGFPGIHVGKKMEKLGMRASDTSEVIFEDLFIPRDNLLGKEGQGFWNTLDILTGGRISIAALSVGIGEGALREAVNYSNERVQFGKKLSQFQAIREMIATMATELEAAWLLTMKAALLRDRGKPHVKESSIAKLFASETTMRATIKCVQILGGYGYMEEYPVEKYMRDAKLCEIGEGTSEIQRLVISKQLLKD
jgi:alkylation response protein AidB-like acyl-CoA dehydrogenase